MGYALSSVHKIYRYSDCRVAVFFLSQISLIIIQKLLKQIVHSYYILEKARIGIALQTVSRD